MWIMYTCVAAVGLVCTLFIQRKVLSTQHEETKTGIEVEMVNAAQRRAEEEARRQGQP